MTATAAPAIEVTDLEKQYGAVRAVDGLSLTVAWGEVFGLLGPNGAGKTTTVETLEGYRRPDGGAVLVLGCDPWREGARLRSRIGVMLQDGGLYPGIRPLEALRLFASYYDDPDDPERRSTASACAPPRGRSCGASPAASVSGSRSRSRSSGGPRSSSSTSPRRAWTRTPAPRPGRSYAGSVSRGSPSSSRRTTWTRPSSSATGWRSSTAVASSRAVRPPS